MGENVAPDCIMPKGIVSDRKGRRTISTHICKSMYKSYSPACIWNLKVQSANSFSQNNINITHCLFDPKNRLIQHRLTFCSDSSILAFTFLFPFFVDWEEENESFNGTRNHIEELFYNTIRMIKKFEEKEKRVMLTSSSRPYTSSNRD